MQTIVEHSRYPRMHCTVGRTIRTAPRGGKSIAGQCTVSAMRLARSQNIGPLVVVVVDSKMPHQSARTVRTVVDTVAAVHHSPGAGRSTDSDTAAACRPRCERRHSLPHTCTCPSGNTDTFWTCTVKDHTAAAVLRIHAEGQHPREGLSAETSSSP